MNAGAELYGKLSRGGAENAAGVLPEHSIQALWAANVTSNAHLLSKLKADIWEDEIHRLTLEDAQKGRMSFPVKAAQVQEIDQFHFSPRYVFMHMRKGIHVDI